MMPPPPPVMTIHPWALISRAKAAAWRYSGESSAMRAEPKMVTFRVPRYGAKTRKA